MISVNYQLLPHERDASARVSTCKHQRLQLCGLIWQFLLHELRLKDNQKRSYRSSNLRRGYCHRFSQSARYSACISSQTSSRHSRKSHDSVEYHSARVRQLLDKLFTLRHIVIRYSKEFPQTYCGIHRRRLGHRHRPDGLGQCM